MDTLSKKAQRAFTIAEAGYRFWVMESVDQYGLTGEYHTGAGIYSQHGTKHDPPLWTNDIHQAKKFKTKKEAQEWIEVYQIQAEPTEHII